MQKKQKPQSEDDQCQFQILPELTQQESAQLQQQHLSNLNKFYNDTKQYAIQNWYHQLKQFTFQSHPFPLTNIQAYLLNLLYHQKEQNLSRPFIQETYSSLINKVDSFLKNKFPEGCFFKLSTRSPKDYSWRYQKQEEQLQDIQKLTKLLSNQNHSFNKKLINSIYRYFLQQSKHKIKIKNGKQFIQIFSKSQRIQIDINDLLYINNRATKSFDQNDFSRSNQILLNVWGRKWVDCQWMEQFRCFYYNYQLTGISQYDQRCYFQQIDQNKQKIKGQILHFFQLLKPSLKKIHLESGVMDVIVRFEEQPIKIELIEINIFNVQSRASLFSWQKDSQILKEGPLQFRYHQSPINITKWELLKMMGMIQRGIQKIMNQVMRRLNYENQWQNYP